MSQDEFAEFYSVSKDRCLRAAVASGMSPADAEDAVAEAFIRAWTSWRKVRRSRSPAAWVVRVAINANVSSWRKRRREVVSELPEPAAAELVGDPAPDLLAAVRLLPERQRDVVVHRYLLDLDTATTAAVLGIAPGTVGAHLHRALTTLRHQLSDQPHVEGTQR